MPQQRPYLDKQVPELENIKSENWDSISVLKDIYYELRCREKRRENGLKKRPKLLKNQVKDRINLLLDETGQGNMTIQKDENDVITNTAELKVDDVVNERVLCPACKNHVFEQWPFGWDAHSAHRCSGITGTDEASRKSEFKIRYQHLFR